MGTIVNIVLPVLFYNRAFNGSLKNRKLKKKYGSLPEEERERLLADDKEKDDTDNDDGEEAGDTKWGIRCFNWFVLVIGVCIGIFGLVYVIVELKDGDAKGDEAWNNPNFNFI